MGAAQLRKRLCRPWKRWREGTSCAARCARPAPAEAVCPRARSSPPGTRCPAAAHKKSVFRAGERAGRGERKQGAKREEGRGKVGGAHLEALRAALRATRGTAGATLQRGRAPTLPRLRPLRYFFVMRMLSQQSFCERKTRSVRPSSRRPHSRPFRKCDCVRGQAGKQRGSEERRRRVRRGAWSADAGPGFSAAGSGRGARTHYEQFGVGDLLVRPLALAVRRVR